MSAMLERKDEAPVNAEVAIVGGGFSGLMTLVHVLSKTCYAWCR